MQILERWLKARALALTLMLAMGTAFGLSSGGVVSPDVMPFGDSEHYVLRGMTLYGYLHTGQWAKFADLFTLPKQSLAPLHYWLFFLLPSAWAGITSYGIIQAVSTYGLMALGAWALCRALGRVEWTAPLFLLCASQNIALDYSYFYFADVPFCALGIVALAWQVRAWREATWTSGFLSGLGAALMFSVKAPNALLFTVTYILAEIIRVVLVLRQAAATPNATRASARALLRHASAIALGYVPMTMLLLACGGLQSIVRLIEANEVSGLFVTDLHCTGLLRLFYFPLCLTYFYHAGMLLLIVVAVLAVSAKMNQARPESAAAERAPLFRSDLLLPLIIAYALFGEFFSFGMANKEMRGLLILLPVFWLAIFWLLEHWRVRPGLLFVGALAYVFFGYSQILFDVFGSKEVNPEGYQLEGDWLSRFPQPHFINAPGIQFTQNLLNLIQKTLPQGGKIAVGTEQLYLTSESLVWVLQHDHALRGEEPRYDFGNFLTVRGQYCRAPLVGAAGLMVFVHPNLQYSHDVQLASGELVQYIDQQWVRKDHAARIIGIQSDGAVTLGYLIVPKDPLSDAQVTALIAGAQGTEFLPGMEFNPLHDRRLSWQECWDLLTKWKQKRLGG